MENQTPIVELQEWTATLTESVRRVALQILDFLPSILGAVVLLLVGWGVARLLRYATRKITEKTLDRLAAARPMETRIQQPRSYGAAPVIASRIVFWVVMLFFILAAAEVVELKVISELLSGLTNYLPRLLTGLIILFLGLWLGEATRAVIARTSIRAGVRQGEIIGRIGQIVILMVVVAIAAGQIGIDNTVLVVLVSTLFAVLLGAIALAFAFGARTTVANMLAAQSIAQTYHAGDTVRIGDIEGRLLRITRTGVVLETEQGQVLVPAGRFSEQVSINVSGGNRT
jgi:small-conductance mechanosensitive channel